jgi:Tfp pilus assembly protein PilX
MTSHAQQNLTVSAARGFDRVAGYALVAILAVLILVALMTNPVLPQ